MFPDVWQLLFFIIILAIIYFSFHQIDGDDANYLNLAIGAFRSEGGVFEWDTMLGDGPAPIHLPTYKMHSYELLFATLGNFLPGKTIFYAHIVLPFIFICLFGLSLYIIYSAIFKGYWLLAALLHVSALFFAADLLPSYGMHGVLRIFQGKVIFLHIIIPLIVFYTVLWFVNRKGIDFFFLSCLQICAVGLTANAVYIAPLSLGLVVFAFFMAQGLNSKAFFTALVPLFATCYPLLLGVLLLIIDNVYPSEVLVRSQQGASLYTFLGWNAFGILSVVAILLVPILYSFSNSKNYILWYVLAIFLILFNPLAWPLFEYVTGNLPIRIYWAVPYVFFLVCMSVRVLTGLLEMLRHSKLSYVLLLLFALVVLAVSLMFASFNQNLKGYWGKPYYRVDKKYFYLAEGIVDKFDSHCVVLVPSAVASNLVMLENHPYPVAVAPLYQQHYRHTMKVDERLLRDKLLESVSTNVSLVTAKEFLSAIDKFGLSGVLINKSLINYKNYKKFAEMYKFNRMDFQYDFVLFYQECTK